MQEKTEGFQTVNRSRDADSLRTAFGHEGCPDCTTVLEYIERSMDSWEYEGFSDVEQRHGLIQSRGFCPLHTWQLAQRSNAFRLSLVYNEVLTDVLHQLDGEDSRQPSGVDRAKRKPVLHGWWKRWRHQANENPERTPCPLCGNRTNFEQRLISTLLQLLRSEEIRHLLSQSTGLCLLHFTQAHHEAERSDHALSGHLLDCQRTCIQRVLEEVQELIRQHDYRFSGEPRGDEMLSWRRAAVLCAGNPGIR